MSQKFVVSHLDEQLGPFDEVELKAKWVKGDLLPIDYVYDEGKQDWILMSERFPWASGKVEAVAPPPLSDVTVKKKMPPEPPHFVSTQPSITIPAMTMPELKKTSNKETSVTMVNGRGEIDISPLEPGRIELNLHHSSAGKIQLQSPLKINVRASEPRVIEWTVPVHQTVGEDAEVHIRAIDETGRICSHYDDHFVIRVQGPSNHDIPVKLAAGKALIPLKQTRAENWKVSLIYPGTRTLQLPEEKSLDWQPGPASKLILDGPQEYVAGHPLKVQVQAVDQYGNLAKTFHGTVVLEVKAS